MNANAKPEVGTVDMEELYRAAVGPRADFYAPKFVRFDEPGASKVSWNWSAFLVSFYWFLYRRMYGEWAIYSLLIPFLAVMVGGIAAAVARSPAIFSLIDLGLLIYYWVIIPMYANALYHRKINGRIAAVRRKVPDPAVQLTVLENGPHTSAIAWVIVLILGVPFVIGILAAIAIPAYQNYMVRAQIYDGLTLAKPVELAVVSHYGAAHQWPAGLSDIGMSQAPSDRYVAALDVDHGTVTITYGNQATRVLAGQTLSLRPTFLAGRITWTCGNATPRGQDPDSGAAGSNQTNIADKYLPVACQGGGNPVP